MFKHEPILWQAGEADVRVNMPRQRTLAAVPSAHPTRMPDGTAMDTSFRTILLVDDDPTMQEFLTNVLESAGYVVRLATSGEQAFDAVQEECPYFVITDWSMSPVNGIEFCRLLRKTDLPHYVYVVLLTGKSKTDDIVTGLSAGADDFITKPVSRGELLDRLQAGARVLELESRLSELARSDPLTGVLNRRTFHQLLEMEWSRSIRYRHPLSYVILDVDFFKKINDSYGHLAGDSVLKSLASLLCELCRQPDYVCRYGGEEFCILLPETDVDGAHLWAERCRAAVAATEFSFGGHDISVTASYGVAQRNDDTESAEELLDSADRALFVAKRSGRNRVSVFGSTASEEPLADQCLAPNA